MSSLARSLPTIVPVRTPYGSTKIGATREDAAEFFESNLFTDGVALISVSGWDEGGQKRLEYAEVLATLHQVYGPDAISKFRRVVLGGGAVYFMGLVQGDAFVAPTLLRDTAIAKRFDGVPALPGGVPAPP